MKKYLNNKEIVMYLIVGVGTTIVSVATYALFRLFINDAIINAVLSWICAIIFAYIMNRKYVFNSKQANVLLEFTTFVLSRMFSLVVEILFMYILVNIIMINDLISKLSIQIIVVILNYILSKIIVFRRKDQGGRG